MRRSYPSDVSREQFSKIESLLLSARKITRPRELDLYDVFCAILYLLKTACQWRMLPNDFPKWRSVHAYFQIWSERLDNQPSLLEQALKKISKRNSN
jgi:transposase